MKLILFAAFLATASAASIGTEHCTWGPAYWCDHPLKAKECGEGATKYCIQNDWAQITVEDSACDDCKSFVSDVKDVLNNGEVQSEILSVIKDLCNKLGSEATTCKLVVDLYGVKFLEALVTDLDASRVCKLLDLCKSAAPSNAKEPPVQLLPPNTVGDACSDCKQIFSDLQDLLSNKTLQQYVFNEVIMLCEEAGLPADLCKMYIDEYGPQVFQYIIQFLDGNMICQELGVCSAITRIDFLRKTTRLGNDLCSDCKQIFSDFDDLLRNKTVQQYLLKEITQACSELGLPESVCQAISEFFPEAIDYIITLLNGDMICPELGVCGPMAVFNPRQLILKLIMVPKKDGDLCTDCKQAINDIKNMMSNKSLQEYIFKIAIAVCELAGESESICKSLVEQYGPEIFNEILQFLDADTICKYLGVCPSDLPVNLIKFEKPPSNGDICKDCKAIFSDLQDILGNKTVQKDILASITKICETFGVDPGTCTSYVSQYGGIVFSLLVQLLDGDTICPEQHLCPAQLQKLSQVVSTLKKIVKGNGDTCTECKEIISDLADLLNNKTAQEGLITELINICVALGVSKDTCTNDVNTFAPILLNYLIGTLKPDVCNRDKLCGASATLQIQPMRVTTLAVQVPLSNGDICSECKQMIADISDILSNSKVQSKVESTLIKVCEAVGIPADSCQQAIDQYLPFILQFVVSELDGNVLCPGLQLCAPGVTRKLIHAVSAVKQIVTGNGDLCSECKETVADLKDILSNQTVQGNLVKLLTDLCVDVGIPADTCSSDVGQYGPLILNILIGYLTPSVCTGLCPGSVAAPLYLPEKMPAIKLTPALPVLNADPDDCLICQSIMDALEMLFPKGASPAQLETEMYTICKQLPFETLQKQCNMFVTNYADRLIRILQELHFAYDKACSAAGICPEAVVTDQASQDPSGCILCEFLMDFLQETLPPHFNKDEIKADLSKACGQLPEGLREGCDDFVKKYGDQIVQFLTGQVPLQDLCRMLKVCSLPDEVMEPDHVNDIFDCVTCYRVEKYLVQVIKPHVTKVDDALNAVCYLIGGDLIGCQAFVANYRSKVTEYLLSGKPLEQMCKAIRVCRSVDKPVAVPALSHVQSSTECVLCELIVKELDGILKKNATKDDIIHALDEVCSILPSSLKADCDAFVAKYIPELISIILAMGPVGVCDELGVCKDAVREEAQVGNEIECQICDLIMEELEALVKRNATEKDVEKFLENICDILPSSLKADCDAFIAKYTQAILALLKSIPPDKICQILGLCSSSPAANPVQHNSQVGNEIECEVCKLVMSQLEALVKRNATEKDIEKFLDNICDILPSSLKADCDAFIAKYTQAILALLKSIPPDKICQTLGLCSSSPDLGREGETTECLLCELVMKEVDRLLDSKATQAEIEKVLEDVCSLLPATIRNECQDFINEYAPQIIQLLLQFVTPTQVCDELKLCTSPVVEAKVPKKVGGVACGPCEMVVEHVEIILREASTQKEIEDFLRLKVCPKLPAEAKTVCLNMVDKYLPEILKLVTSMTPEELCGFLGLCSSEEAMEKMINAAIDSSAECMICELIVKELRTGLSQNATEAEIQKLLDTVCSKIPLSSLAKDCQEFVDDYTKPIIQYLLAGMDPDTICDFLKVCDPSKLAAPFGKVNDDTLCLLCDVLFGIIETQLENNKTLEEVTQLIEKVCPLLPESLAEQCKGFLDLYGPVLLKLIVDKELSPPDICKDLRLCSSSSKLPAGLTFSKGSLDCAGCKDLVTALEDFLEQNVDKVMEFIAKICDLLPEADRQECKNYIEVYGSYLLELILEEFLSPETLCKDLKLCTQSLVGLPPAEICNLGPTFWCASMDNAKLCNTVQHCRRHAWN
ncbi:uncharacterized protein LOC110977496 isoform X2 [Acanthaster planci]|uniref:Uncharacterized protein LOC110977496 isoform X2 n=1 Tax=Acanthaster planci TaxID=133434 RepID=A0A8B7Y2I3_ACAPL|nr:uncharacterized protein LOC110977496 isoform X2 [Acanthaster planci]